MTAASPGPVKLKSASLAARFSTIRLPLTSSIMRTRGSLSRVTPDSSGASKFVHWRRSDRAKIENNRRT